MPRYGKYRPTESSDTKDPQGFWVLMEQHFEWMRVKNYSERTIECRRWYLGYFINWCTDRGIMRPNEVTKPILERYQRYLYYYRKKDGEPLSFYTQAGQLGPIRAWFKWMTRQNHLLYNPASELELPKLGTRLPKNILTQREADLVINQPNTLTPEGIRDRAILETFYSTGMRRMEVIRLRMYDIDSDRGTVLIEQGKNKKDRVVPIGDRALHWIARYVAEVRPMLLVGDAGGDTLFLMDNGQPFRRNALTWMVGGYVKQADIGKKGSCHLFRHTMATLMLEGGADVRYIQAMLGHVKLDTTMIYTQVSIRQLKRVHELTHPARMERKPK